MKSLCGVLSAVVRGFKILLQGHVTVCCLPRNLAGVATSCRPWLACKVFFDFFLVRPSRTVSMQPTSDPALGDGSAGIFSERVVCG